MRRVIAIVTAIFALGCSRGTDDVAADSTTAAPTAETIAKSAIPDSVMLSDSMAAEATRLNICGSYPNCGGSACFGNQQRCSCRKDDANKQCTVSACRHDPSCPRSD